MTKPKPFMNLDDVEFDDIEDNGYFTSRRGQISDRIGAQKLGYNLTVLPPGKAQCPFHSHHGEEEMFFILQGEGELRFGDQRYPIRAHDVIACPTGGPEVAHQIINTGTSDLRYLALSNLVELEACQYPDSNKVLVVAGPRGQRGLRGMFRAENTVDYYDRESNEPPAAGPAGTGLAQALPRGDHRQRLFGVPPAAVFDAIRNPARLARWWGPEGFTNSFHEFQFQPGGHWRLTMQGPDGKDYPNHSVFTEIVENRRVVVRHQSGHQFSLTIELIPHAEGTLLRWSQLFDTPEEYARIAEFVAVANEQNLDRLGGELGLGG